MTASKKKRLQAAGWNVGDARTFLGLSDEEAALVEMKLVLAEHLRRRRRSSHVVPARAGRSTWLEPVECRQDGGRGWLGVANLLVKALLALSETPRGVARVLGRHAA